MFTPKQLEGLIAFLEDGTELLEAQRKELLGVARADLWNSAKHLTPRERELRDAALNTEKHAIYGWTLASRIETEREARLAKAPKIDVELAQSGQDLLALLKLA